MPGVSLARRRWLSRSPWAPWRSRRWPPRPSRRRVSATTPAPREGGWMKMHARFLEQAKKGDVDLLFLGDSITQGWPETRGSRRSGSATTARATRPTSGSAATRPSTSSGGSRTARSTASRPKVVVLMIGTNNVRANSADEIADGIKAIVKRLREKLPEAKILLLGVFPRGERPNPGREQAPGGQQPDRQPRRRREGRLHGHRARGSSTKTARSRRTSCPTTST